jgi:hypothetical protein
VAAIAAGGAFIDDDTSIFEGDIEWMAANGITLGCNPPTNDRYCPDDAVTRGQMAAFMKRLSTNNVVDAATLDGKDSSAFVQKGEANSVSSSMMTDSAGVAQATDGSSTSLTATTATILSVDIDAPAAGYVLVQVTWEAWIVHTNGTGDVCLFDVSSVAATPPSDIEPNTIVQANAPSGTVTIQSAASRVFAVAGAGTHSFYFVGREQSGDCTADDIALTAMYVPVAHGALAANTAAVGGDSSDG